MSGIFSLVGENYRDSWYEPKNRTRMETKIKDITGAEITVTDLKRRYANAGSASQVPT